MNKKLHTLLWVLVIGQIMAQIPSGYYDDANGKTGYELKTALKTIITNGHNDQGYSNLYTLYETSDSDNYYENDGTVLDMYSEKPSASDAYNYTHGNNTCGNYSNEGDCYNREHLMPQSVFGSASPMKSDGHFVVPSDGKVNGQRSNYPFGIVTNPTWTSTNGSKVGPNSTSGYSDTVFEPIDEFKGDIARMLFYFATRYEDDVASWTHDMLNGTSDQVYTDWFLNILLQWDADDPVSQREIDRNDAVYNYQGNRNPFIDHPEWVNDIWGNNNNNGNGNNGGSPSASEIIAIQDFENTSPQWNYTENDSGYSCFTINTNYKNNTTRSLQISGTNKHNADPYIELDNIDISSYTNVKLWVYFAADGPDSKDDLYLDVSYDNGSTWTSTKLVDGYSGTDLNYGDTNASDPTTVSSNPYSIDIADSETQIKVRVRFDERSGKNNTSDFYYVDDIKLEGEASSSNDTDAYADSGTQPGASDISSTKDTPAEAVNVFVIDIYDQGTSDGLNTKVTKIRIKPNSTNTADWTDNIQGFMITDSNGTTINPATTTITDSYADFTFNAGDLEVPNNDLIELTFAVYLNTSNIQDGKILSFMVDADDHGFTADNSGTGFETTFSGGDFSSHDFTIDVSFSEIRFEQQPSDVEINTVMNPSVVVIATDENGNVDIDFTDRIGLTTTGSFASSATTVVNAVNGIATFDNLIFDTVATDINITTTDPDNWGWINLTSNNFDVTAAGSSPCASELIISEYFEGSSNNKYLEFYNGTGSSVNMDNYQIKIYANGNTSPTATIDLNAQTLNDGDVFVIAHSDATIWGGTPDQTSGSLGFNGDDAIELYNTSTNSTVDVIGEIGEDPGSAWGNGDTTTKDHTLVRKDNIIQGDTNGSDPFTPSDEWIGYEKDVITHLGSHTMNCGACTAPTTDAVFDTDSPQNITGVSADLSWSNGSGDKRIVVIRDGSDVTFIPSDDTTYTANSVYGQGTDVSGNGEYVVYNGTGTGVNLTGLSAGHTYFVKIFEYNCAQGSEKYDTSGTPATDFFVTIPNNPADFSTGCITNSTINLSWSAPVDSEYDGYVLVVRAGNNTPHSISSTNPLTINGANTNYPDASEYGSTTPNSRYLYVGTDTSVTITGLTENTTYTFKLYAYAIHSNDYQYSSGTQTVQTIDLNQVNSAHASPGNAQATIFWVNPDVCFDEILVVANETAGIDFSPVGDGTAYTANSDYTNIDQVVYKGIGNTVTVTSLTNGTTYYFEIFVRKGSEWSNGIEVSTTPMLGTEFQPGQLIFVAYDGQINGSGADDEYLIATLVDIIPGTTFSLVNSRYEAGAPANVRTDKWGGAGDDASKNPGVAEITYTGTNNIPAGSILRLDTDYSTDFITFAGVITGTTETDQTSDFSVSVVYGQTSIPNISSSGSDQIFLVQGVFVYDGTDDPNQANYILQGRLLHGITNRTPWVELSSLCNGDSSGGDTRESRLHPALNCFNIQNSEASAISGFYQNDDLHDGSFRDIILAVSNAANWTLGTDRYSLNPATTNATDTGHTFTISGSHSPGTWVSSSDTNWFNCSNWETLAVPDAATDVYIDANSSVNAVINAAAPYADLFNGIAECNNLEISNVNLVIEGNQSLIIHGNLTIGANGVLDADDENDTTVDGSIFVQGNWTIENSDNFIEGNSTVIFEGNIAQSVSCNTGADTEQFYNLKIDNVNGVTFASGNIHAIHDLTIQNSPAITVTDGHYILAGNSFVNNTDITISNQGSLVQTEAAIANENISGSGTFTMNKTSLPMSNYYDYVYWSSPIYTTDLTFEEIVPNAWRYYAFDPAYQPNATYPGWIFKQPTDTFVVGEGYAISAPTNQAADTPISVSFHKNSAPFNNGQKDITLKIYDNNNVADGDDDFNLIGNPYPSAIDFNAFAIDNINIQGAYYAWTNCAGLTNGHHQDAGYAVYSAGAGGVTTESACSGNANSAGQYIASGQAVMVEAIDQGTISFKNSYRVINHNDNFINRPAQEYDRLWLEMTNDSGAFNQIAIGFYDDATNDYDRMYDAYALDNGYGQDFYSLSGDTKLNIQGLTPLEDMERIVPIGYTAANAGVITIHINHLEGVLNDNYDVLLQDLELNTIHNLKATDYVTTTQPGEFKDRFKLLFSPKVSEVTDQYLDPNAILLIQNKGLFRLLTKQNKLIRSIKVYDISGKLLIDKQQINQISYTMDLRHVANGNVLLFHIELVDGAVYIKKAIK